MTVSVRKKSIFVQPLAQSRAWMSHNLGWHHCLDTNLTGKKIKPAPSQSLSATQKALKPYFHSFSSHVLQWNKCSFSVCLPHSKGMGPEALQPGGWQSLGPNWSPWWRWILDFCGRASEYKCGLFILQKNTEYVLDVGYWEYIDNYSPRTYRTSKFNKQIYNY